MSARAYATAVVPQSGGATVAFAIADFLVRTERERQGLYGRYLNATVRRVSPLLMDLFLLEGINLASAAALIRPPQDWPWRPVADRMPAFVSGTPRAKGWLGSRAGADVRRFRRAFADPGVVIRDLDDPRGRLAIRPCDGVLGFTAALGPCLLGAFGASAELKLPGRLPDALMTALPGRPLRAVVDHPLFAHRGYAIRRAVPDLRDGLPVLTFRAPLVPFELPMPPDRNRAPGHAA